MNNECTTPTGQTLADAMTEMKEAFDTLTAQAAALQVQIDAITVRLKALEEHS